jgi:amino acid transporter
MTVMLGIFAVAAVVDIVILLFTSHSSFIHTFNHYAGAGGYQKVVHAGAGKGIYPSDGGYSFKETLGAMFVWVGFTIWVFYGAYVSGEVRRAGDRKRMLTSLLGSGAIQTLFVLVSIIVFYKAVGQDFVISAAAGNQSVGVATFPYYAALATGSEALAVIIAIGFLFWALPVLAAGMYPIYRGFFVYSFERLLPPRMSRVNTKTHTPLYAIALMALLSIIDTAFNAFNANFSVALTLAELPSFFVIFFVAIAALVMPWRRPDLYKGSQADWKIAGIPVLPVAGALAAVFSAFLIVLPFFYQTQLGLNTHSWLPAATAIAPVAAVVIGIIWWYIARARNRARGINMDLMYKTIPPD